METIVNIAPTTEEIIVKYDKMDILSEISLMKKNNLLSLLIFNEKIEVSILDFNDAVNPLLNKFKDVLPYDYEIKEGYVIDANGDTYYQMTIVDTSYGGNRWCILF